MTADTAHLPLFLFIYRKRVIGKNIFLAKCAGTAVAEKKKQAK
jgi:hypothetical protein